MRYILADQDQALILDGNAVAGLLAEIFGVDMTLSPFVCVQCGREGDLATLPTFTQAPGVVLRCPTCESVVLRVVQTPDAIYLDARGTLYLRLGRRTSGSIGSPGLFASTCRRRKGGGNP